MESCIFSNRCQFARYGLDNANILQEYEFSLTNNWSIDYRKFAATATNIPMDCGESCPVWSVTEFLLRKNRLLNTNVPAKMTRATTKICETIVDAALSNSDSFVTCIPKSISCNEAADFLTYYSICTRWRGSAFSTVVYNLNFSSYLAEDKKTWNVKSFDNDSYTELDYIRNIIQCKSEGSSSNLLIISGLDFINFKDHPCDKLFEIIMYRQANHLPFIVVMPEVSNIVGEGLMFNKLAGVLKEHKVDIKW